jgi:hypothetical protein
VGTKLPEQAFLEAPELAKQNNLIALKAVLRFGLRRETDF